MIAGWVIILVALIYLSALFTVAHFGDLYGERFLKGPLRSTIYALTLAVYCTSWTFFGSVGLASSTGLDFLGIYFGPILVISFGHGFVKRVVHLTKSQNILSVSDFVAARYGKSSRVAAIVAFIAVIGSIPYIALQLKAITISLKTLLDSIPGGVAGITTPTLGALAFVVAFVLAGFTVTFGTRHIDSREHHTGLTIAVAFESAIKLAAFLAVGVFVVWGMFGGIGPLIDMVKSRADITPLVDRSNGFATVFAMILLSFLIILLLPRQFHMTMVENRDELDTKRAAWMFPIYLVLINLFVIPIALSSNLVFPPGMIDRDMAILELPLKAGNGIIALIVFLGGLSAATAMVIVECVALGTMISNDLVMPLLPTGRKLFRDRSGDLGSQILWIRRIGIILILLLGFVYFQSTSDAALASIGLVSFAAIAQIAPSFFGGLFWRRGTALGATAGLLSGLIVWIYTLVLPNLANPALFGIENLLRYGPFDITWLKPTSLFGFDFSPIANGAFFSLLTNIAFFVAFSFVRAPSQIESNQADFFVEAKNPLTKFNFRLWRSSITVGDLKKLVARYLGAERTQAAFLAYHGNYEADEQLASIEIIRFAEYQLASAIGAASSRRVISILLSKGNVTRTDALQLLDEASAALQQNRELLQHALDHARQGVTVFDSNRTLLCWNRAFQTLFDLPDHMINVGTPLEHIIRYNTARNFYGPGQNEIYFRRRYESFIRDTHPVRIRTHPSERWLEIRSEHLPDGGIVTTYTDITETVKAEESLSSANQLLESRVRERTEELLRLNRELSDAKAEADDANLSKTRFLAAASHDILQPLNAARLYSAALLEKEIATSEGQLVQNVATSLEAVEEILTTLLDISRLDAGAQKPELSDFPIEDLFSQLRIELEPSAQEKGLTLDFIHSSLAVRSDKRLLRRMMQNLVSNAIKYTPQGRVLVGCRRRGSVVSISIIDSGIGIPLGQRKAIFKEFRRLDEGTKVARGLGLGLSIVERIARLLKHPLKLQSVVGQGSHFSIEVPLSVKSIRKSKELIPRGQQVSIPNNLPILVIDNDEMILEGMKLLMSGWGCTVYTAKDGATALREFGAADTHHPLIIADYHLDYETGLDVIRSLRKQSGSDIPAILLTADRSKLVREHTQAEGISLLHKPVKPASLRAVIMQAVLKMKVKNSSDQTLKDDHI